MLTKTMATIYDVAKESGVSLATVSNVINNGPRPVRPETRQRILDAIEKLNYHPNAVARGLARQKTHTIGIMFGVVESSKIVINAYSAAILQAVLSVASETGYNVTHLTAHWRGAEESLRMFRDGRTDGNLIVAPPMDSDLLTSLASLDLPLVAISPESGHDEISSVDIDDAVGTRLVMEHLIGLGHRSIAHIAGPPNLLSGVTRLAVYIEALTAAGLEVRSELICHGEYSPEAGHANAKGLLSLKNPPTAIFAANDEIAYGVLEAAQEMGVRVPSDLSLVGVDDRPMSSRVSPPLTTVRQPFDLLGRRATRMLIDAIEGEISKPQIESFAPQLVVRQSTASPS